MTAIQATDDFASVSEVALALANLSKADMTRIKQIAKLRSAGLDVMGWEDLLNESLQRMLEGVRRWPKSVPFIAFLAQTVRSVASDEWRRLRAENTGRESDLGLHADGSERSLADLAVNPIDPEREVVARRSLEEIEALFADDSEALGVIHGLAQGSTPQEVQHDGAMNSTQYASAQKRIRRRLSRLHLTKDDAT